MQEKDAVRVTMEQIDMVHKMNGTSIFLCCMFEFCCLERYSETFEMALTAKDIEDIVAKGKIASLIGMVFNCLRNPYSPF